MKFKYSRKWRSGLTKSQSLEVIGSVHRREHVSIDLVDRGLSTG
jgi:hypothetical protein